ncbi:MAG: hypothetical protein ACAH88_15220, partial [Roseimicrobium sp.]
MMRSFFIPLIALFLAGSAGIVLSEDKKPAANPPTSSDKPASRTTRNVEGWTVRVDDRLLSPPHAELGSRVLSLLQAKLTDITRVMAPDQLAKCRRVTIVVDLSHGALTSMQYHPSGDWLKDNGYAEDLAKCVHIPVAER